MWRSDDVGTEVREGPEKGPSRRRRPHSSVGLLGFVSKLPTCSPLTFWDEPKVDPTHAAALDLRSERPTG